MCLLNPCVTSLATGTKSSRHPAKIRIRLAPHPIFRVASTHNIPPSIFKLSSEALQTSTLPNSDPDNPPSESCFWGGGDYQSLQCLGWERSPAGWHATCWFSTSSEKQDRSLIHPVSGRRGRLRREALCVWDAVTFSQQTPQLQITFAARAGRGHPEVGCILGSAAIHCELPGFSATNSRRGNFFSVLPRISATSHIFLFLFLSL